MTREERLEELLCRAKLCLDDTDDSFSICRPIDSIVPMYEELIQEIDEELEGKPILRWHSRNDTRGRPFRLMAYHYGRRLRFEVLPTPLKTWVLNVYWPDGTVTAPGEFADSDAACAKAAEILEQTTGEK
jgi:hypothetical protein